MHPSLLDDIMALAVASGGSVKFDLKAWNDHLHVALTGATNKRTFSNFRRAARWSAARRNPPSLIASTLLVPGYVEETEVRSIARFIAALDPDIPYSLLAFYPHFYLKDLPMTTAATAQKCLTAAKKEGLRQVRIGNRHLLV
jgi:pyruvate formate lyase activating enzyme